MIEGSSFSDAFIFSIYGTRNSQGMAYDMNKENRKLNMNEITVPGLKEFRPKVTKRLFCAMHIKLEL